MYAKGFAFQKGGVMLTALQPAGLRQLRFWDVTGSQGRKSDKPLMQTMDRINSRYGKNTLGYACSGLKKNWEMQRGRLSPEFTTKWSDIPVVKV
jgi:DNA polymerase V